VERPPARGLERLRLPLAATALVLVAASVLDDGSGPARHVAVGLGLVLALALVGAAAGLTPADCGLAPDTVARGVRWGAAAASVVGVGTALAYAVGPVRDALQDAGEQSPGAVLMAVLVVIPLGTVLPEEFAFRGVLWGLLHRSYGRCVATAVSSALFGAWHVSPALGGGTANEAASDLVGSGGVGLVLRVAGTVLVTGLAGAVLAELRVRSGSLVAPIMLHWAINAAGALLVVAA
jgi:uncharacterized protein